MVESGIRAEQEDPSWRCQAVTKDPRNPHRVRIACRNEVVRLIRNRGPAAAASLSIVIAVTTAIRRVTQNNVILSFRTREESRVTIVLSYRHKHRMVGQAYRG
jgi:hypothetical protein